MKTNTYVVIYDWEDDVYIGRGMKYYFDTLEEAIKCRDNIEASDNAFNIEITYIYGEKESWI